MRFGNNRGINNKALCFGTMLQTVAKVTLTQTRKTLVGGSPLFAKTKTFATSSLSALGGELNYATAFQHFLLFQALSYVCS